MKNFRKMKLAAGLFALTSASQRDWVINQWWTEANNMYDFAVANSAQFQVIILILYIYIYRERFRDME